MSTRANLIKAEGLVTNQNELSTKDGSMRQATNVNIDEQGVITPRRGFNDYGDLTNDSLNTANNVKQLFEYKERIFRHYGSSFEFENNLGTFSPITGNFNEVVDGVRIKFQEARGNMFFTTSEGIKKISLENANSLTENGTVTITDAGVPRASYIEAETQDAVGGFLPAQSKVAYRYIFGTRDTNNNLLLGSPSSRFVLTNSNEDVITNEEFTVQIDSSTANIADGDYILIPTLDRRFTLWFDVSGSSTQPIDSNTLGSTFIRVDISNLTITDNNTIAAFLANQISTNIAEYTTTLSGNNITLVSTEEGNIDNAIITVSNAGAITETSRTEGSVVRGSEASANVTVLVPSQLTTDYFIQVYRTNFITAVAGLNLDDIDPGDETNLVYETGLTQAHITAGELTFTDNTPESFRAASDPLYTNEITGDGILQSNDVPPIAQDVELFRGSMFYANTKSTHRLEFTLLSVDDYVANSTTITIGNSTVSRYYTAGTTEVPNTLEGGDFLLSTSTSVAQAIDETARSLVKIINQDADSIVNAFYLTGADDLPGQILLEARTLVDDTFTVAVIEPSFPAIGEEFNPTIPTYKPITSFTGLNDSTRITLNGHGFSNNEEVYVSYIQDNPTDPESFSGIFTISNVTANTFDIDVNNLATVVDFIPTRDSSVYSPFVKSDNLEVANRIYYSKRDRPEAVPFSNFINVGAQDEPIKRILALRDNLFVLKDDGVFVISGTSAPNFSVRQTDSTRIIATDSAVVLNNQIYCLTEQGISKINGSGQVGIISRGIENLIDEVANATFDFARHTFGVAYENDRAYILFMPTVDSDNSATQAYRYNIFERTWTRWEYAATCGRVMLRDDKLYVGNGDRNVISQERKKFDRTDFTDRDFSASISNGGVRGTDVEISTTTDVEVGDVIVQELEVTIHQLNIGILARMDLFDTGLTPPTGSTFEDTFGAVSGRDISTNIQALNDYLVTLDPTNITAKIINSTNVRSQFELLIDELNTAEAITEIKDYDKPVNISYEAYITEVDPITNVITVNIERPFLAGEISIFKGYDKVVEWNPQHFGDPSAQKQVREVTIMFDQNNFYNAVASFGSDLSQGLVRVPFSGKGLGYFGDMSFSAPNSYWGGAGNDIPFRTIVPIGKQRCRYLTMLFSHRNARENFRIVGISAVVRPISSRAYR